LDFTGPFLKSQSGNSYILVIVEAFSRYVKLIPTKDQTAETASAELFNPLRTFVDCTLQKSGFFFWRSGAWY